MSLAGTIGGYLSGSLAQGAAGDTLDEDFVTAMGADLLHFWRVRPDTVTLNGGNISAISALAGSADMAEATTAQQPLYHADGGPSGQPYLELQDSARNIGAAISVAAGHRVGMFAVVANGGVNTVAASSSTVYQISAHSAGQFRHSVGFSGGVQAVNATSPAGDSDWHVRAIIPAAAGALSQIDGATTTPNFTGTDTVGALSSVHFGFLNAIVCGGKGACIIMVDDVDAAKAALVYAYVNARYGL